MKLNKSNEATIPTHLQIYPKIMMELIMQKED